MKKIILLIFSILVITLPVSISCNCGGGGSFCEGITNSEGEIYESILIVRGKIISKNEEGMNVAIEHNLFGDFNQDEVYVRQGYGIDCSMQVNDFEESKEYIFALWGELNGEYSLSICYESFLEIKDEVIFGNIAPGIESIDYVDLGNVQGCGEQINIFSFKENISIFPNPTFNALNFKNLNSIKSAEHVRLTCFDMLGRELRFFKKEDGILAGEIWTIDLHEFSAGIYMFKLSLNYEETVFRIVKQ